MLISSRIHHLDVGFVINGGRCATKDLHVGVPGEMLAERSIGSGAWLTEFTSKKKKTRCLISI